MGKSHNTPRLPVHQLLVLSICRFAEPIALSSVSPYLPEMVEGFSNVSNNDVAKWVGVTSASFSLSQALFAIAWGRASDRFGRKPVILCAMTCIMSTSLLFGFSTSLEWAIAARALAGASNGTVGVMRTMVAELVPQRQLQPRAFSIMPLVWSVGSIIGPAFGGLLAKPVTRYPKVFGRSDFLTRFPFALPNIIASAFFLVGLIAGTLFLHETLAAKKYRRDYGLALGQLLFSPFRRTKGKRWQVEDESSSSLLAHNRGSSASTICQDTDRDPLNKSVPQGPPTYHEVFSYQSNMNLLVYTLLALHSLTYDQLLPILMHSAPATDRNHSIMHFTGGFGIDSDRIGLLFMLYGIVGVLIQFLLFPPLARKWGVLNCLKIVSLMFPFAYILTPFTVLCPSPLTQQVSCFAVMLIKCWAVIFAFPCTTILLTNSAPSLRVLGTLNGIAVSFSALGRAVGPAIGGWSYTLGLKLGFGILPWWTLAAFAVLAAVPCWWLVEMEGFGEVEGAEDDDEEYDDILPVGEDEDELSEGRTSATKTGSNPGPGAEQDDFKSDGSTLDPAGLSKVLSQSSGSPLRRVSSPIGMRDSVGRGTRLSNGLGQSNNGFGASGASCH